MQVFMDSSDWLKGIVHHEAGTNSSSPSTDLITCPMPPVVDRRLRPSHDRALNCPRCDSTHTKFCYYNNYSLSQPRYFCKTCRRYWTKGGSLRNVPVGGGCRKNKRSPIKKPLFDRRPRIDNYPQPLPVDLQLSFLPDVRYNPLGASSCELSFAECKYNSLLGGSVDDLDLMGFGSSSFDNHGKDLMEDPGSMGRIRSLDWQEQGWNIGWWNGEGPSTAI